MFRYYWDINDAADGTPDEGARDGSLFTIKDNADQLIIDCNLKANVQFNNYGALEPTKFNCVYTIQAKCGDISVALTINAINSRVNCRIDKTSFWQPGMGAHSSRKRVLTTLWDGLLTNDNGRIRRPIMLSHVLHEIQEHVSQSLAILTQNITEVNAHCTPWITNALAALYVVTMAWFNHNTLRAFDYVYEDQTVIQTLDTSILAFLQGSQPRLGEHSLLRKLDSALYCRIVDKVGDIVSANMKHLVNLLRCEDPIELAAMIQAGNEMQAQPPRPM